MGFKDLILKSHALHHISIITVCKGVDCASGVGLPPAALSLSFLDKRVGTGPVSA